MRIKGIHRQFHGTRGTLRDHSAREYAYDNAKLHKQIVTTRDIRNCGLEILPMHGVTSGIEPASTVAASPAEVRRTSASPAYVPAPRPVPDAEVIRPTSEELCLQRVKDVLARLGIDPDEATRSQIARAKGILLAGSSRPLLPV